MRVRGSGCRFQVAGHRYRLEDIRRVLIRKGYQLSAVSSEQYKRKIHSDVSYSSGSLMAGTTIQQ